MLMMLIYFLFFSMTAAFITLWLQDSGIGAVLLIDNILGRVQLNEILVIMIKCITNGLIIGLYAIHYGATMEMRLTNVVRGMSIATTRALVLVLFINIMISILVYR
jgi:ABC-type transporter Mla maintaining outer membrane lipid asymmetry permease subunit MlaE